MYIYICKDIYIDSLGSQERERRDRLRHSPPPPPAFYLSQGFPYRTAAWLHRLEQNRHIVASAATLRVRHSPPPPPVLYLVNLDYVRINGIYRVTQAEYAIRIIIAASQEYVKTYSTRRLFTSPPPVSYLSQGFPYRTAAWLQPPLPLHLTPHLYPTFHRGSVCVGVGGVVLCRCVCV